MPSFLIRDIPPGIYKRLKEAAELNQRSLNKEILRRLEASLRKGRLAPEEFRRRMAEIRSHQLRPSDLDPVALIRADRDDPNR